MDSEEVGIFGCLDVRKICQIHTHSIKIGLFVAVGGWQRDIQDFYLAVGFSLKQHLIEEADRETVAALQRTELETNICQFPP